MPQITKKAQQRKKEKIAGLLVKDNLNTYQIAKKTGCGHKTVTKYLLELEKEGRVSKSDHGTRNSHHFMWHRLFEVKRRKKYTKNPETIKRLEDIVNSPEAKKWAREAQKAYKVNVISKVQKDNKGHFVWQIDYSPR